VASSSSALITFRRRRLTDSFWCLPAPHATTRLGTVDIAMERWHRLLALGTPHARPLPAVATAGGVAQRGEIRFDGSVFNMTVVPKQNRPGIPAAASHVHDHWAASGARGADNRTGDPDAS
jgi:hypothetical protein